MPESKNDDSEIALAYSQKFWEAGNLIVIMMFTLAFAVYLALIQFCNARRYVAETDNFIILVVLAFVGNGALIYLLEKLCQHEIEVIGTIERKHIFVSVIKGRAGLE
jgi:hypothetical protein